MAQTDVNTAFYRILAPSGMSEYFILPSVSTRLLLLTGVIVPESFATLDRRASTTSGLCNGCFLGALFLSEDGESVRAAGFSADAMLMDRHRAPAMTRESICFGVYVDRVCAVGCDRPRLGRRL